MTISLVCMNGGSGIHRERSLRKKDGIGLKERTSGGKDTKGISKKYLSSKGEIRGTGGKPREEREARAKEIEKATETTRKADEKEAKGMQ